MEGRTYRYYRGQPLFAFGHGLSYTTFAYDDLRVTPSDISPGSEAAVSATVANTGDRSGDEVVQLYIRHRDASVPRPIQELKGFARVSLRPGERKTLTFTLGAGQLGVYDGAMQHVVQPGTVEVMIGSSSDNIKLKGELRISGTTAMPVEERVFFFPVHID